MDLKENRPETANRQSMLDSFNPNTGELLGRVPIWQEEEVRQAVETARRAQQGWARQPVGARLALMRDVQSALVDNTDEIAALVSREVGKPLTESLVGDVLLVLTSLAGYTRTARRALRPERLHSGILHFGKKYTVIHEPLGVVAVISPFNFPVLLSMQSAFAALIAGNAVVHKPSEFAPLTAELIQDILHSTNLDPDLFKVVQGYGETGWALAHAGVDHVSFVGSTQTGRKIASATGEQLIGRTLELGGNNAMIVMQDAPLERVANAAMTYGTATSGQMCGAVSRLLVHEEVLPKMERLLRERLKVWRTTNQIGPGESEVTSLISQEARQTVWSTVQEALQTGASSIDGGGPVQESPAPLFRPTILTGTSEKMVVRQQETFGPVLSLIPFKDEAEALRLANDTDYGLTASVWTLDLAAGWRVARGLRTGSVAINDHLWPFFAPEIPWGGVDASGTGRVGGEWGLLQMTYPKVISRERTRRKSEFYWQPATRRAHRLIRDLIPALYSGSLGGRMAAAVRLVRTLFARS